MLASDFCLIAAEKSVSYKSMKSLHISNTSAIITSMEIRLLCNDCWCITLSLFTTCIHPAIILLQSLLVNTLAHTLAHACTHAHTNVHTWIFQIVPYMKHTADTIIKSILITLQVYIWFYSSKLFLLSHQIDSTSQY